MIDLLPCLEIVRLEETGHGTFGVLRINKELLCCTLEPPDEENAPNVSSIPAQQYRCMRYKSRKHPNTFEVLSVPGRSGILFHAGNTVHDTAGCIILGETWRRLGGERILLNSGNSFRNFMAILDPYQEAHLTIHEHF